MVIKLKSLSTFPFRINLLLCFLIAIFFAFPLNLEAAGKSKVAKDQKIKVTPIESEELNFCGNGAGGFAATYQGKTIRIVFDFGPIVANLKGSPQDHVKFLCAKKLSFLNTQIEVIGHWAGKDIGDVDAFFAKKIVIPQK
jgi:hypothetical protein